MRESIGGTWITGLVITFIFVFVGFLALSLNYSRAFRVKNELLDIIEKYQGLTDSGDSSILIMNNYLKNNNYKQKGKCPNGWYGCDIGSTSCVIDNATHNYCVSKVSTHTSNFNQRAYYNVAVFFKFNLPIIGDLKTFSVEGQTNDISNPQDGSCLENKGIKCLYE